jgi:hypothetical protein
MDRDASLACLTCRSFIGSRTSKLLSRRELLRRGAFGATVVSLGSLRATAAAAVSSPPALTSSELATYVAMADAVQELGRLREEALDSDRLGGWLGSFVLQCPPAERTRIRDVLGSPARFGHPDFARTTPSERARILRSWLGSGSDSFDPRRVSACSALDLVAQGLADPGSESPSSAPVIVL